MTNENEDKRPSVEVFRQMREENERAEENPRTRLVR